MHNKQTNKKQPKPPKPKFPTSPTLKRPIDPWWLCALFLIWWEMTCKINLWRICDWELRWNTCLCEALYTFEWFSATRLNPVFLLMLLLKWNAKCLNLIIGYEKFYLCSFIPHSSHFFWKKNVCCSDRFGGLFLYQACSHFSESF